MTAHISVVGDVMLDVFSEGSVHRISPEAPVPVLLNPVARPVLGGAANCALNAHRLGADTALIAMLGEDDAGKEIRRLLAKQGIYDHTVSSSNWHTIRKERFLVGGQQILRADWEYAIGDIRPDDLLLPTLRDALNKSDVIIVSDYDKGTVGSALIQETLQAASARNLPVIVDTKRDNPKIFRGATVLTPNLLEASRMTGLGDATAAGRRISEMTRAHVIVTLGPEGMLVCDVSGGIRHIPSAAQEVADVTGAGDTVTAALAVALAAGRPLIEAAEYANAAAAVAVARTGTYAVAADEVQALRDGTAWW